MSNHKLTYTTAKTGEEMRRCAEKDKQKGLVALRIRGDHMIESNARGSAVCKCHGELCVGTKRSFLKQLLAIGVITSITAFALVIVASVIAVLTNPAALGRAIALVLGG